MPYAPLPWTENPRGVGSVFDDSIPPVEDEPRKPREEPLRDDAFWNHEGVEAPPAFADNELVITYDWYGTGMYDLDTGTTFLGATFGYGCGGGAANDYCEWVGGDNTGLNGEEVVRV